VSYEQPPPPTATNPATGELDGYELLSGGGQPTAGVIAPPPLIYLGALGVGFGLDGMIGRGSLPSAAAIPAGSALIIAGSGLLGSFARAFRGAQTPIDPYTPPTLMVTNGPFRLTRNPAYLGMALTYAGIAIVANAPWALVPLPIAAAIIDRGVIAREERYLERKFGDAVHGLQATRPGMAVTRRGTASGCPPRPDRWLARPSVGDADDRARARPLSATDSDRPLPHR
jgi:protein-S-isoprenylcysteine O-methyltransferase Ste14